MPAPLAIPLGYASSTLRYRSAAKRVALVFAVCAIGVGVIFQGLWLARPPVASTRTATVCVVDVPPVPPSGSEIQGYFLARILVVPLVFAAYGGALLFASMKLRERMTRSRMYCRDPQLVIAAAVLYLLPDFLTDAFSTTRLIDLVTWAYLALFPLALGLWLITPTAPPPHLRD